MIVRITSTRPELQDIHAERQPFNSKEYVTESDVIGLVIACTYLAPEARDHMRTEPTAEGWRVFVTDRAGEEAHRFNVNYEEADAMTKQTPAHDPHAVTELVLYIENTSAIYEKLTKPTCQNLAKHHSKGKFDPAKALISMQRLADEGAKAYVKEFGSRDTEYHKAFTKADRTEAAAQLLAIHMEHIDGTNPL